MADIAINPVTRRVQFTGNTGTGPFAFTFNILADEDIAVYKNTTLLTLTADYTVATSPDGTGSITLTAGLVSSDVLTIIGGRELSRTTDFVTAGDLLANSLNEQLDSNVIMAQQLDEKLGRSLKVNPGDVYTDLELPFKDDRKGTVLGFNATSGDPEAGPLIADVQSLADVSADIATLADIEDGTVATNAISNTASIASDVSTVSGISGNVTTVAGISSNVTTVAGISADVTTVAGVSADVDVLGGIAADISAVAAIDAEVVAAANNVADITYFGDVYYGPSATDPTTRRDLTALQAGDLYFNTGVDELRVYTGTYWADNTVQSVGNIVGISQFTGDGATVAFALGVTPTSEEDTQVYLNGVYQHKDTYSVASTTLTFDTAPPTGISIEVVITDAPADVQQLSGDSATTDFALSTNPGGKNNTQIYISGIYQQKSTYGVFGTTLRFDAAPPTGTNNIEVVITAT